MIEMAINIFLKYIRANLPFAPGCELFLDVSSNESCEDVVDVEHFEDPPEYEVSEFEILLVKVLLSPDKGFETLEVSDIEELLL